MTITFKVATTVTAVACTLYKADEITTAGVVGVAGGFVNSSGTLTSDVSWQVSLDDFDPTTLALVAGLYVLKFIATPSDGDSEVGKLGIRVTL